MLRKEENFEGVNWEAVVEMLDLFEDITKQTWDIVGDYQTVKGIVYDEIINLCKRDDIAGMPGNERKKLLYVSAKLSCLEHLRKQDSHRHHHQRVYLTARANQETSTITKHDIDLAKKQLVRLIEQLPKKSRSVMTLIVLENKTDQEVAELLNMRIGTVQTQKSRALSKLVKKIGKNKSNNSFLLIVLLIKVLMP